MKYINQIKKIVSDAICEDGQLTVVSVDSVINFGFSGFNFKEIYVGRGRTMMAAINKIGELHSYQIVYSRYVNKLTDYQKALVALKMDDEIPA